MRRRGRALVLSALIGAGLLGASARAVSDDRYFETLAGAPLVVVASVLERELLAEPRLVVYRLSVRETLQGRPPETLNVVQELIFQSDTPWLEIGAQQLFVLEPLPNTSRFQRYLRAGIYYQIRRGRAGIQAVEVAALVKRYLEAVREPADRSRISRLTVLVDALRNPNLFGDAAHSLEKTDDLGKLLTDAHVSALGAVLSDHARPVEQRRRLLDLIRNRKLSQFKSVVKALLAEPSVAPFARQTLAALGDTVPAEALAEDLKSPDANARIVALEGTGQLPVEERMKLLAPLLDKEEVPAVRVAIFAQLAKAGPPAVPVLAKALNGGDMSTCYYATYALAQIGNEDAVSVLERQFQSGTYEAQVASVFALRQIGSKRAFEILTRVKQNPPDPRLEKVIDFATTGDTHKHQ